MHADRGGISCELIQEKILKLIIIESTTVLSDYDEEKNIARICRFCRAAERHFQHLDGPINVSVDLEMMFCACECLCMAYLFESGEVTA